MQVGGADADPLVKGAAHRQQQPLQGDVVGNVRVAHRAEQDGLLAAQLLQPVLRHHPPGFPVVGGTPRVFGVVEAEARGVGRQVVEDFFALGYDFRADAVAAD